MNLLKISLIILFILMTAVTVKFRPEIHQPMIIEDMYYVEEDSIPPTNIPTVTIKPQGTSTATAKQPSTPKPKKVVKIFTPTQVSKQTVQQKTKQPKVQKVEHLNTDTNPNQELLDRITKHTQEVVTLETPVEKKPQTEKPTSTVVKIETPQQTTTKHLTEQEEIIAWNIWRSNVQNKIMRDAKISYVPLGTRFDFTFIVDKFGNVSNIKVECSNQQCMNAARNVVKPAIANLQRQPILNFPEGTRRNSTVFTGYFTIATKERLSTPANYSDYERIKN